MDLNEFLFLLKGLEWTLALTAIGFAGGAVAGLAVALGRTSGNRVLRQATAGVPTRNGSACMTAESPVRSVA